MNKFKAACVGREGNEMPAWVSTKIRAAGVEFVERDCETSQQIDCRDHAACLSVLFHERIQRRPPANAPQPDVRGRQFSLLAPLPVHGMVLEQADTVGHQIVQEIAARSQKEVSTR